MAAGETTESASRIMGVSGRTLRRYLEIADSAPPRRVIADEVHVPMAPPSNEPIEDLLARKKRQYSRQQRADEWSKLIPVTVKDPGPVLIVAVGDPHVDNDLCDIGAIERDMTIVGRTPGAYALHLGDITDNWVGRLGALYANSSTKASDGVRLAQWMFDLAPPLAVVGGNHDLWNGGMTWLNFVLQRSGAVVQDHGVRMEIRFPFGKPLRIHARHDFPGHSQYNPLHGLRKEHLFGLRDHVNIAGHKHIDSAAVVPSPEGFCQWMFRVSGYKGHDDYAKALGVQPMKMSPAVGLLIDPMARVEAETIKPYWDLEEAADVLAFKRRAR
jgi:hypothetical protein